MATRNRRGYSCGNHHVGGESIVKTASRITATFAACLVLSLPAASYAEDAAGQDARQAGNEQLARAAQNPVADMMSFPF
jgi:hypothetical protein